jgi:hypothetical protein
MSMVQPRLARIGSLGLALALALLCGTRAGANIKSRSELAAIVARSPGLQLVAEGQELKTAELMAARLSNAVAYRGVGESMEPLYPSNTAVVVVPIEYDRIKKGMTVVYVNDEGRRIAHCVVGETHDGFLVQGVSNDEADSEVATEQNFIGVIIQAYASAETGSRHDLAMRLRGKGRRVGKRLPLSVRQPVLCQQTRPARLGLMQR